MKTFTEEELSRIVVVEMNVLEWMAIHGNVCLGLRHPKNTGPSRMCAEKFLSVIEDALLMTGVFNTKMIQEIHKVENDAKETMGITEISNVKEIRFSQKTKSTILDVLRKEAYDLRRAQEEGGTIEGVAEPFRKEMDVLDAIKEIESTPLKD